MPAIFPAKGFYFFFFAALAALAPFLVLYYEDLGLNGRQIGVLSALPPLVTLFAASIWGALADTTRQHQRLLVLAVGMIIVMMFILSQTTQFLGLVIVVLVYAFFWAPIIPLVDNTTLELLGEQRDRYGRVRLWGAIGWGLSGPIAGLIIEDQGLRWAFYIFMALMAVCWFITMRLPVQGIRVPARLGDGMQQLLRNREWALFLLVMYLAGFGSSVVHVFLFLYLEQLSATNFMMGLALTSATLSELVVFFYADRMLRSWGTRRTLIIAVLALAFRLVLYSFITLPWLALVVQLLHGLTFAAMWAAAVAYAHQIAPPGLGATAQGMFNSVSSGLGAASGAFVGGLLYDAIGVMNTFRWLGVLVAGGLLLFVLLSRRVDRRAQAMSTGAGR